MSAKPSTSAGPSTLSGSYQSEDASSSSHDPHASLAQPWGSRRRRRPRPKCHRAFSTSCLRKSGVPASCSEYAATTTPRLHASYSLCRAKAPFCGTTPIEALFGAIANDTNMDVEYKCVHDKTCGDCQYVGPDQGCHRYYQQRWHSPHLNQVRP